MKKFFWFYFLLLPSLACAHAVPVSSVPDMGSEFAVLPAEVRITFSEHIVPGSATLKLFTASGTPVLLPAVVDADDTHVVAAPLSVPAGGITLAWSVVSGDDGHYTRGAFQFTVGHPLERTLPRAIETRLLILALVSAGVLLFLRGLAYGFLERFPRCRNCVRSYTLLEALVGLVVFVYAIALWCSAPPPQSWTKTISREGITTQFSISPDQPRALLIVEGADVDAPLLQIEQHESGIDPMEIALTPRQEEGVDTKKYYTFPASVFTPSGVWHVSLTFVHAHHYDVHCAFDLHYPNTIEQAQELRHHAPLVWLVLLVAFGAVLLTFWRVLIVVQGRDRTIASLHETSPRIAYTATVAAFFVLLTAFIVLYTSL